MNNNIGQKIATASDKHAAKKGQNLGAIQDCPNAFSLRFTLVDQLQKPIQKIPYKTLVSGTKNADKHLKTAKTNAQGKTPIVTREHHEKIDFYVTWPKINVNKSFFKVKW